MNTQVKDALGQEMRFGNEVAFYYAYAEVKKGTIVEIRQTVWEAKKAPHLGTLIISYEGGRYKRRADQVILLNSRTFP